MHIGHEKHLRSSHIHVEDANWVLGYVSISKLAVGATTVFLAQASKQLANIHTLLLVCIAMLKLPASET